MTTTIRFDVDSSVPPERIVAALTDFSPKRREVFTTIDPSTYRVNSQGEGWADVTEGRAGGIWERSRYDWSQPNTVRTQLISSNVFGPGSYWLYRIEPRGSGSHVQVELVRVPSSLKGRLLAALLGVAGARMFKADLQKSLAKLR